MEYDKNISAPLAQPIIAPSETPKGPPPARAPDSSPISAAAPPLTAEAMRRLQEEEANRVPFEELDQDDFDKILAPEQPASIPSTSSMNQLKEDEQLARSLQDSTVDPSAHVLADALLAKKMQQQLDLESKPAPKTYAAAAKAAAKVAPNPPKVSKTKASASKIAAPAQTSPAETPLSKRKIKQAQRAAFKATQGKGVPKIAPSRVSKTEQARLAAQAAAIVAKQPPVVIPVDFVKNPPAPPGPKMIPKIPGPKGPAKQQPKAQPGPPKGVLPKALVKQVPKGQPVHQGEPAQPIVHPPPPPLVVEQPLQAHALVEEAPLMQPLAEVMAAPQNAVARPIGGARIPNASFIRAAAAYSVRCPEADRAYKEALIKAGIQPEMIPLAPPGPINAHRVSAAVRQMATVWAFKRLAEIGIMQVQSLFGSPRDLSLTNHLNAAAARAGEEPMILTLHQPQLVPQDSARQSPLAVDFDINAPAYLMVDVYSTPTLEQDFNPDYVRGLLRANQVLMWIGFRFTGAMGVHFQEGAWFRTEDGQKIISFPDDSTNSYAPHSACDWIHLRENDGHGHEAIHWSVIKTFGEYSVVLFQRGERIRSLRFQQRPTMLYEVTSLPRMPRNFIECVLYDQLLEFPLLLRTFWPKEQLMVDRNMLRDLETAVAGRQVSSTLFRQTIRICSELLTSNATWQKLARYDLERTQAIAERCALLLILKDIENRTRRLMSTNVLFGGAMSQYNTELQHFGKNPTTRAYGWVTKACFTACAAFIAYKFIAPMITKLPFAANLAILAGYFTKLKMPEATAAVCRRAPLLSALIEELAYSQLPGPWAWAIPMLEMAMHPDDSWTRHAVTIGSHGVLAQLPTRYRVPLHIAWDVAPRVSLMWDHVKKYWGAWRVNPSPPRSLRTIDPTDWEKPKTVWDNFRSFFYGQPMEDVSDSWVPTQQVVPFTAAESEVPRTEAFCLQVAQCPTLICTGMVNREAQYGPSLDPITWLLPTSCPFYAPRKSARNLWAVVHFRIMAAPPMLPLVQAVAWAKYCDEFVQAIPQHTPLDYSLLVDPWFAHFKDAAHKARYRDAIAKRDEVEDEILFKQPVQLMIKTDEVLVKRIKGQFLHKPRAIAVVDPQIQVRVGPYIYKASERLKKLWWLEQRRGTQIDTVQDDHAIRLRIRVYYGIGRTDYDLSQWMHEVMSPLTAPACAFVIVAGDDSLVAIRTKMKTFFIEGDATMFDQSQSIGPLRTEYLALRRLGVPQEACDMLERVSRANYVAREANGDSLRIKRQARPMRDTGGPDTSLGNSLVMIFAWLHVLNSGDFTRPETYNKKFDQLGFEMKTVLHSKLENVSFLKGKWYEIEPIPNCDFQWVWGPLPSRMLKIGKSLRPPAEVYKTTPELGALRFLQEQAIQLSFFLQVPILRAFVKNFVPESHALQEGDSAVPLIQEEHKVQASGWCSRCELTRGAVRRTARRYGVPLEEFEEVEQQMPTVPFRFLDFRLFQDLAACDYGG